MIMQEHQRDALYPKVSYSKDMKWCAFNFYVFAKFYEHDKGFVRPKDNNYTAEDMVKLKEITEKNHAEFAQKFPIEELVRQHEQRAAIERFTGITDKVGFIPRTDPIGVLIFANIPIYATQLNISVETTFLQVGMHNGGHANIGLMLSAYGLKALKTLYKTYGYNESAQDLPSLDFQKNYFKAVIPFIHLDEKKKYDLKVGNIMPQIKENSIEFTVPFSIGDSRKRSQAAFFLLEKAMKQAAINMFLYEELHSQTDCKVINFAERSEKLNEKRKNKIINETLKNIKEF